jgi:hypothetical protein
MPTTLPAYVVRRNLARFLVRGGAGWAWRALKNLVGRPLGRRVWFAPQDVFFAAYLYQLLGGPPVAITCDLAPFAHREGAGSQASMMMAALNFARVLGLAWRHTPFVAVDHAGPDVARVTADWEAFFNLGASEAPAAETSRERIVDFGPASFFHLLKLFVAMPPQNAPDGALIPHFGPTVLAEFRHKYRANKPQRLPRSGRLIVALHVRRHVAHDADHPYAMSLPRMAQLLTTVERVVATTGSTCEVRVYSQGKVEEFSDFVRPGVTLHLDTDPLDSLAGLIDADLVILSRGSFSYVAGLLSEGIVIADPYYPPQDDWLVCDEAGSFDEAALAARLAKARA